MEEKKMVSTSQKISFHQQEISENWISPMVSTSRKKYPNNKILFQVDRKSVSTSKNGDFV